MLVAIERCNHYEKLEPETSYHSVKEDAKIYETNTTSKTLMRLLIGKGEAPELPKKNPGEVNIMEVIAKYPSCN